MGIVINGSSAAGTINLGSNGTITNLAVGGIPDGTVDADTLASNAVTSAKVADDAITNAKVAADAIDSAELADGGIDSVHLASGVGGKVLNITSNFDSGKKTTAATSYTDMSESSTITVQKTGSKMIVFVSCSFGAEGGGNGSDDGNGFFRVVRTVSGSDTAVWSELCKVTYLDSWETNSYGAGSYAADMGGITFQDTHGVSAGRTLTYALQGKCTGPNYVQAGGRDDDGHYDNGVSFVIMEVDT